MRREFLKNLGIEDKDLIDKILDENSADIGRAKTEVDDLKSQVATLQGQLSKKTSDYDSLKESTKDYETLSQKINQLELDKAQLTTEKAQLTVDLDTKVAQLQKTHAIETSVRDAKARNVKAVIAQLDVDKITFKDGELSGLSEQLDALKSGEDTAFLFGENAGLSGTHPSNPPVSGNGGTSPNSGSLADAVAKALGGK